MIEKKKREAKREEKKQNSKKTVNETLEKRKVGPPEDSWVTSIPIKKIIKTSHGSVLLRNSSVARYIGKSQ